MKNMIFTFAMLFVLACSAPKNSVHIPANQTIEMDYPQYGLWMASLKNKSMVGVDIHVINKSTKDTIRGFGLNLKGQADVMVERDAYLCIVNTSDSGVDLKIGISEQDPVIMQKPAEDTYRSFTLRNNSATSIPLLIPDVMNPNLSPFSNSGVDLKMGQEILFKYKGRKRVLLIVDESISHGDTIDVSKLLTARKAEIDNG